MAVGRLKLGTRTALTTTALNSLAAGTYVSAGTITWNAATLVPLSSKLEVQVTPGTVAGNKQVLVFARPSMDGTNFQTGPVSGSTATDEPNLIFVGSVPCNTNATLQRGFFDLAAVFGGSLPHSAQIIVKNDTGAALAATGHSVHYTDMNGDIT